MNKSVWKDQNWILETQYPKGIKKSISVLIICSILLLSLIFCYHYPVYETFYGMVNENNKNIVTIMVPFSKIGEFEKAIVKNKDMKLISVESNPEFISGNQMIKAEIRVSISQKLLVENNIVVIRVKIKDMSIWKEFSQKWKKGMKNEANTK
jgi:hypothetical protein